MAKREKCEHGNTPVSIRGCAECVIIAMGSLQICRSCGIDATELLELLRLAYPTESKFKSALSKVREKGPQCHTLTPSP